MESQSSNGEPSMSIRAVSVPSANESPSDEEFLSLTTSTTQELVEKLEVLFALCRVTSGSLQSIRTENSSGVQQTTLTILLQSDY